MKKKTTATTIETRRLLIVRTGKRQVVHAWCGSCRRERHLVTMEYAALLSGLGQRQLFREVEDGQLHFSELVGKPLLCLDSLREIMRRRGDPVSIVIE
jgi:hypothetical protein